MMSAPKVLLAVDPGIRGCGAARFFDGKLEAATYVKNPCAKGNRARECAAVAGAVYDWADGIFAPDELAVELPRVYASRIRMGQSTEDPNDLLALAGIGAALAMLVTDTTSYIPSEWKGQMPKDVCRLRVEYRLNSYELKVADAAARAAKSLDHNVWDAIGIGLHHLGRFKPKRRIP